MIIQNILGFPSICLSRSNGYFRWAIYGFEAAVSSKYAVLDVDLLQNKTPQVSVQIALEGGENYGLLVTIPPKFMEELSDGLMKSWL